MTTDLLELNPFPPRKEWCLPMFRKQPGLLGVLFLRQDEDHAASPTIWEAQGAVETLQRARLPTRRLPTISKISTDSFPASRALSVSSWAEISVQRC